MAMYNAWCDRVPVIVMGGNIIEANKRAAPGRPNGRIRRSIPRALTRDFFVKWDDQPVSLQAISAEIGGAPPTRSRPRRQWRR